MENRFLKSWAYGPVLALFFALLSGCGTTPPMPDKRLSETPTGTDKGLLLSDALVRFSSAYQASADTPSEDLAKQLLASGKTLLQLRCEDYLDAIGMSNQSASNVRQQIGLSGGVISGLMGITGSTAKQVAGVSSLFSFSGASFDAYTTAYLFSDAGTSVIQLVRKAQIAYMEDANKTFDSEGIGHKAVMDALLGYEAICRPGQIRSLIKDAISKAEIVAESDGADVAAEMELATMLEQIRAALGLPSLVTESEGIQLYRLYLGQSKDPLTVGGATIGPAEMKKLAPALTTLSMPGSKLAKRWKGILAKQAAEAKAKEAKDAEAAAANKADTDVQKADQDAKSAQTAKPADPSVQAASNSNAQTKAGLAELKKGNIQKAETEISQALKTVNAAPPPSSGDQATKSALDSARDASNQAAEALRAAKKTLDARRWNVFKAPVLSVK